MPTQDTPVDQPPGKISTRNEEYPWPFSRRRTLGKGAQIREEVETQKSRWLMTKAGKRLAPDGTAGARVRAASEEGGTLKEITKRDSRQPTTQSLPEPFTSND